MIGVYDYTVILTYLSMISGAVGMIITMTGIGHPYFGILFLMISGLLDGVDGAVARTKKNRTELEKNFGVQIDSFSDLICFGVLPATIGIAQLRVSGRFTEVFRHRDYYENFWAVVLMISIAVFYILMALIRLAYFNVTVEQRREEAKEYGGQFFYGLPVTTSSLVFPLTLIVNYFVKADLTVMYFFIMFVVAILFVGDFKIPKFGRKGLSVLIIIGLTELAATIFIFTCG